MSKAVIATKPPHSPTTGFNKEPIQRLIRQILLDTSLRDSRSSPSADAENRVLLDTEVDGVRCLLVRAMLPPTDTVLLSPREQEIARMIAKGYPNKTIASVLDISCWTVGSYLRRIFGKLHVTSRAAMVARFMESANVEPGPSTVPHPSPLPRSANSRPTRLEPEPSRVHSRRQ
jgi:two-component system nitrate/nitrite response regulator NarL